MTWKKNSADRYERPCRICGVSGDDLDMLLDHGEVVTLESWNGYDEYDEAP